jgi:hypothetical protein
MMEYAKILFIIRLVDALVLLVAKHIWIGKMDGDGRNET